MEYDETWNFEDPITILPKPISDLFSSEAKYLKEELSSKGLEVILIPAPEPRHEGHMVRATSDSNPEWYKKVYHSHAFEAEYKHTKTNRLRKCLRSKVSRKESIVALDRLVSKKDKPLLFHDTIYRELIFEKLYRGQDYSGESIPFDQGVVDFFDEHPDFFKDSKKDIEDAFGEIPEDDAPF